MGWLDQIKAKRAERREPADGRATFGDYEFTEDRREMAERARETTGDASGVFENARLEREREAERERQRALQLPHRAEQVHFDSDEMDPEAAARVERGKPRRSAKRIRTPIDLYYFPTPQHFVPLELTVLFRDGGTRAVDCFLYDVNDSGISFAAPQAFEPDSELTILGHHAEEMTPLVATDVTIVNHRPIESGKPVPPKFSGRALWVHGTRMEIHDALLLYKATLDSIALRVALAENPTGASDQSERHDPAPGSS